MAEPKVKTMKPKSGGKGRKGKVHGIHVRRMNGPKGQGFHVSVDREPDADDIGRGRYEPEEQFHPNLRSAFKHAETAFGPPDAGEPEGGDAGGKGRMTPAAQDTDED